MWKRLGLVGSLLATLLTACSAPPRPYVSINPPGVSPSESTEAAAGRDKRFGLVEAFRLPDAAMVKTLGVGYQRLVFRWDGLQPTEKSSLNPHYFPLAQLDTERRKGMEVVGLLIGTPAWAASKAEDGPRSVPRNVELAWDDPQNWWGRFAEAMAREHAGRVDDWIVWNEPDIQPQNSNAAYYAFAGGVEDYYQLLKVAYRSLKKGNPQARVHLAGLTYWSDKEAGRAQYFERLLDLMATDDSAPANNYYFDVANLHLYTGPHSLYEVPQLYQQLMQARGLDKPIWINETNVIPYDDPTNKDTGYDLPVDMRCTLADQTAYLFQAFSLALAGGAERVSFYKAVDASGAAFNGEVDAIERAALVREDGSKRPVFQTYEVATRYLAQATQAKYLSEQGVERVVVEREGGARTTVLWNARGTAVQAQVPANSKKAQLLDDAGQITPIAPDAAGNYLLDLPPATCRTDLKNPGRFVVGGPVSLIVESDTGAADEASVPASEE